MFARCLFLLFSLWGCATPHQPDLLGGMDQSPGGASPISVLKGILDSDEAVVLAVFIEGFTVSGPSPEARKGGDEAWIRQKKNELAGRINRSFLSHLGHYGRFRLIVPDLPEGGAGSQESLEIGRRLGLTHLFLVTYHSTPQIGLLKGRLMDAENSQVVGGMEKIGKGWDSEQPSSASGQRFYEKVDELVGSVFIGILMVGLVVAGIYFGIASSTDFF